MENEGGSKSRGEQDLPMMAVFRQHFSKDLVLVLQGVKLVNPREQQGAQAIS
jgi:hypothetical protein